MSTQTFKDSKTGIDYHHCKPCEYIFKVPSYYQDFKTQEARYNLHTNDENDLGYKAYFQRFLDFVLPQITSPKDALDFGCGASSILATLLESEGFTCDYYDPIYHPTLNEDKSYDLIVCTEVFEHLHNPREIFKTLISKLNKGGYLAIQTQFHSNDTEVFKKWYYHQDPTHIVFFTAQTFQVLCKIHHCNYIASNGKNMVLIQK